MFKPLFSVFIGLLITCTALAKTADTAIMYFRFADRGIKTVHTLDSADYFLLVLPADSTDDRYNIKEYYKNGIVKLIGKADPTRTNLKRGWVSLDGPCISYYPSGKKEAVMTYKIGHKDGLEYLFYTNGVLHGVIKHFPEEINEIYESLYWTCYDLDGREICTEGKGIWKDYNEDLKTILAQGEIKRGHKDGEWTGKYIFKQDTVKYIYHYNGGDKRSGKGFDKSGTAYSFYDEFEKADYNNGPVTFISVLRDHIKLPSGPNGIKMQVDTSHISFVVEKDGSVTPGDVLGYVEPDLKKAILTGLAKCHNWTPTKLFGVPFRTRINFSLREISKNSGPVYLREVSYEEQILTDVSR